MRKSGDFIYDDPGGMVRCPSWLASDTDQTVAGNYKYFSPHRLNSNGGRYI